MSEKDSDLNHKQKTENQQFNFKTEDIKVKRTADATDFAAVTERGPSVIVRIGGLFKRFAGTLKNGILAFLHGIKNVLKSIRGKVTITVVAIVILCFGGLGAFLYISNVAKNGAEQKKVPNISMEKLLEDGSDNFLEDVLALARKEITERQNGGQGDTVVYYVMNVMRQLESKDHYETAKEISEMVDLSKLGNGARAMFYDYLIRFSYAKDDKNMEEHYEGLMRELPEEDRIN